MNRDRAYVVLTQELERFRRVPREDLIRFIGGAPIETTEWHGMEPVTIEIRVEWADTKEETIRIRATANGPTWWRLDRFEETVLVHPRASE